MSPAHGRPPSKDPKNINLRIKLTESQKEKLDFCTEQTGLNMSDIIRKGIDEVCRQIKEKNGL